MTTATKTKHKYVAGDGPFNKERVQEYGDDLQAMADKHGGITPQLVLEAARDPRSVLHECFEWDDAKGGEAYRIIQCRWLIGFIKIKVVYADQEVPQEKHVETQRQYQSVTNDEGKRYQTLDVIVKSEDMRQQVELRFARDLERIQRELEFYAHLSKYATAVGKVVEGLRKDQ